MILLLTQMSQGLFGGFAAADINGERQVFGLISASQYAINIPGVFSASAAGGGGTAASAAYQVNTGLDTYVVGLGWGADPWSSGGWGFSRSYWRGATVTLVDSR